MVSPLKRFLFIILIVIYLTGCTSFTSTPTLTPTPAISPTLSPVPSPTFPSTSTPDPTQGSSGIGDSYYPDLGNGGYDVQHYTIVLDVDPTSNEVIGKTIIEARAIQNLSSLNLDFQGFTVQSVIINGTMAKFTRQDAEMTVYPDSLLAVDNIFQVEVNYQGIPKLVVSKATPMTVGWFHSDNGTINVLTEPDGASAWFPGNNHPRDKATYRFEVTVPNPWVVAATGSLVDKKEIGDKTTFIVEMDKPMATYLAAVNIGQYDMFTEPGPNGVSIRSYYLPDFPTEYQDDLKILPSVIDFFESLFGPYPFKEYGVVIAGRGIAGCDSYGTADETQSLSIYCATKAMMSEEVIVHELAHQWFGDNVSLKNWQDVWLKEGFATYAEWLWFSKNDPTALMEIAKNREQSFFDSDLPVAKPLPGNIYTDESYTGGALVLQALRLEVGDETFLKIIKTYQVRYGGGNAGSDEFIALAEEVSGRNLSPFFSKWLFSPKLPGLP